MKNRTSYYYYSARLQLRFCMKHRQLEVIPEKFQMIMLNVRGYILDSLEFQLYLYRNGLTHLMRNVHNLTANTRMLLIFSCKTNLLRNKCLILDFKIFFLIGEKSLKCRYC